MIVETGAVQYTDNSVLYRPSRNGYSIREGDTNDFLN